MDKRFVACSVEVVFVYLRPQNWLFCCNFLGRLIEGESYVTHWGLFFSPWKSRVSSWKRREDIRGQRAARDGLDDVRQNELIAPPHSCVHRYGQS